MQIKLDKKYWHIIAVALVGRGIAVALTIYAVAIRGARECNPFMSMGFSHVPFGLEIVNALTFVAIVGVMIWYPYHYKSNEKFSWKPGLFLVLFTALLWLDAFNDIFATLHWTAPLAITFGVLTLPYHVANISVTC